MQLNPREYFTVVRQIEDHTDSATYYVRAVIRNAKTDALLATLDLEDKTGQRFSKSWLVPADVSGQGYYISILTSVYTDSGYTTKSQNYGDKMETLLVQERQVFNPNYPIPVGPDISYKKIKEIVEEIIDRKVKIPKSQRKAQTPDVITPLKKLLVEIREAVAKIKIPEIPEPVRFDQILGRVERLISQGQARDYEEIKTLVGDVRKATEEIKKTGNVVLLSVGKDLSNGFDKINESVEKMKVNVSLKMEKPEGEVEKAKETAPGDPRVNRLLRKK